MSGLFFIFFFMLHFGLFAFVQMGLFFGVSSMLNEQHVGLFDFFLHMNKYLSSNAWLMLSVFVVGYGFKVIAEFILNGRYQVAPMMVLMFEPYGRIFIQQFTVIIGAYFLMFGAEKIFVLVFTAIKVYFSLIYNYSGMIAKEMDKRLSQQSNNSHS